MAMVKSISVGAYVLLHPSIPRFSPPFPFSASLSPLVSRSSCPFWICFLFAFIFFPSSRPLDITLSTLVCLQRLLSADRHSLTSSSVEYNPSQAGHFSLSERSQLITALFNFLQLAVFGVWSCLGASAPETSPFRRPPSATKTPLLATLLTAAKRVWGSLTIYPRFRQRWSYLATPSYRLSIASHGAAKLDRTRTFSPPRLPISPDLHRDLFTSPF